VRARCNPPWVSGRALISYLCVSLPCPCGSGQLQPCRKTPRSSHAAAATCCLRKAPAGAPEDSPRSRLAGWVCRAPCPHLSPLPQWGRGWPEGRVRDFSPGLPIKSIGTGLALGHTLSALQAWQNGFPAVVILRPFASFRVNSAKHPRVRNTVILRAAKNPSITGTNCRDPSSVSRRTQGDSMGRLSFCAHSLVILSAAKDPCHLAQGKLREESPQSRTFADIKKPVS